MRRARRGPHLIDPADLADADSVRPPGGSLIDMHAHSSNLSRDSGVAVGDLIAQAKRRGLDAICLTEHNALWPDAQIRELGERHAFTVLPGMELGTDMGHVLVFGLPRYHPELLEIEQLRRIVTAEGGVAVQAHPMRYRPGRQPGWGEMREWFDGVEVVNGDHSDTVGATTTRRRWSSAWPRWAAATRTAARPSAASRPRSPATSPASTTSCATSPSARRGRSICAPRGRSGWSRGGRPAAPSAASRRIGPCRPWALSLRGPRGEEENASDSSRRDDRGPRLGSHREPEEGRRAA